MSALLAGLDESAHFDSRGCGQYLGTSAGSIVAASLAAGLEPGARLGALPEQGALSPSDRDGSPLGALLAFAGAGSVAAAPLAALALSSTARGGALLRRTALRRVPEGRRSLVGLRRAVEQSGVRWDGRLRVAAVEVQSGSRVIFGAPGAPELSVALAVEASCAIPGVFSAVRVGERSYVDGGVWSPTNMDAAEVRSHQSVLCLNPTGSLRPALGGLTATLGPISRGIAATEALALKHRGASVTTINPDSASASALGIDLMDPSRRGAVIEAGVAQGRRLAAGAAERAA